MIKVCLIEPGFVHSDSFRNTRFSHKSKRALTDESDAYHRYYSNMISFIGKMMMRSPTTPQHIARKIIKVMRSNHPPLRVPATYDAIFFSLLRRLLPMRLYHWLLYRALPGIEEWVPTEKN